MRFLLPLLVLLVAPTARADDEAPPLPPPRPKIGGFSFRVQGGYGTRGLFDDTATGGAAAFGIGGWRKKLDAYGDFRLFLGDYGGLHFRQYSFAPTIEYELAPRFRMGFGLFVGGTTIARRTSSHDFDAFSIGTRVLASFDIWSFDEESPHRALFVLGEIEVGSESRGGSGGDRKAVDATAVWGPTVMLGARF